MTIQTMDARPPRFTTATRTRALTVVRLTVTWIAAIALVGIPLYVIVLTALKPADEARSVNIDLPSRIGLLENLAIVIGDGEALRGFINSCIVTVPAIVVTLLLAASAAWIFGRARHRVPRVLYYLVITGIMLPPAIVATIRVLGVVGLDGTQLGLILFYCGTQIGGAVFLMTGFVKGIPYEMEEAARIDGASALRILWSIILPSLRPVILVAGVYLMLTVWNDFFYAFFILRDPDHRTMPLGLYGFAAANMFQFNWSLIFTYVLLTSIPIVVAFLIAQKRIVSGLLGGIGK
ncbi:MAG: carbohydrate ABC transporter permease [Salinibacterium sp.]|nr:carbohydrate ABC transporter permease [Salinibacterium sp.]